MDFSSFLEGFIKKKSLNNTKLAEKLEVPAATISHLLSGRNKPSLDFLQRLIKNYPTLDLYEIMGLTEYNKTNINTETNSKDQRPEKQDLFNMSQEENKELKKIVLLFKDGTFEEYNK